MFFAFFGFFDSSSVSCYKYRRLWRNHRKLLKRERERERVKEKKKKKKKKKTKNRFFLQRGLNRREERGERGERRDRFVYKLKKSQNILEVARGRGRGEESLLLLSRST